MMRGGLHCKRIVFHPTPDPAQANRSHYDPERSNFFFFIRRSWHHMLFNSRHVCVTALLHYQPCDNGGRCVLNNASSYTCICAPGWSGQTCRLNVNDCVQHWCQNGATCVDEVDGSRWGSRSPLTVSRWRHPPSLAAVFPFTSEGSPFSFSPPFKMFSAIFSQLHLSARIRGRLLRAGHRLLCRSPLLWARCLPGPAEQLHLPLPAWIWGAALSTGNQRVRQHPLCTWRDLRGPDEWLSVPVPPRFWGWEYKCQPIYSRRFVFTIERRLEASAEPKCTDLAAHECTSDCRTCTWGIKLTHKWVSGTAHIEWFKTSFHLLFSRHLNSPGGGFFSAEKTRTCSCILSLTWSSRPHTAFWSSPPPTHTSVL